MGIREARVRLGVPDEVGQTASSGGWVALALGPDSLAVATTHPPVAHRIGPALWVPREIDGEDNWIVPASSKSELTRVSSVLPERRRPSAPMTPNAAAGSGSRRGSVSVAMALANDEAMMERAREHFSDGMLAPGTLRTKNCYEKDLGLAMPSKRYAGFASDSNCNDGDCSNLENGSLSIRCGILDGNEVGAHQGRSPLVH